MVSKQKRDRIRLFFFILFMTVFCGLIYALFVFYSRELDDKFFQMEKETVTAYSYQQSQQVYTKITALESRMRSVAENIDASNMDPEGEWFTSYLAKINENLDYEVQYLSAEILKRCSADPELSHEEREFYRRILEGQDAVSKISYSPITDEYHFFMGYPIVRENRVTGMFRCLIGVDMLIQPPEHSAFYSIERSSIVDRRGTVLFCDAKPEWIGRTLYELLIEQGIAAEALEHLPEALSQEDGATLLLTENNGEQFLASVSLGLKDWNLVSVYRADALHVISGNLFRNAVVMGLSLMLLTFTAGIIVYIMTAEERKRLELDQERYSALANFSDTVLFEYEYKADTLHFTSNVSNLLFLDSDTIQNLPLTIPRLFHPADAEKVLDFLKAGPQQKEVTKLEARIKNRKGNYSWCELRLRPVAGTSRVLIGKIADITERKEKELTLMTQSSTDPLTGLLNREAFAGLVDTLLENQPSGFLFMFDVDNFKQVNDTLGHENGDRLLMRISCLLRESFRESDPVGRFGGDEFVAFMADTDNFDIAKVKAGIILSKMEGFLGMGGVNVSVSIGIAIAPRDGTTFADLFRHADQAMYDAKKQGKNCFMFCEDFSK